MPVHVSSTVVLVIRRSNCIISFDVLLTVHLSIILAIGQLNHKFLFCDEFIVCLYMFRPLCAHHLEVKLYYTASGIVTLCRRQSGTQVRRGLCTGRPSTGVMIPDAL